MCLSHATFSPPDVELPPNNVFGSVISHNRALALSHSKPVPSRSHNRNIEDIIDFSLHRLESKIITLRRSGPRGCH